MEMTKDSYWFKHDSGARNDVKVVRLTRELGIEGYGIYFMLIEVLREQLDFKLPFDSIPDLAYQFHTSDEKIRTVVTRYELFTIEEQLFFSERLIRQMDDYQQKRNKLVEAGRKGGQASPKQRLSIATSDDKATPQASVKQEEEIRGDKRREEAGTRTLFEVFRMNTNRDFTDAFLKLEIEKFKAKYPKSGPEKVPLILSWISYFKDSDKEPQLTPEEIRKEKLKRAL